MKILEGAKNSIFKKDAIEFVARQRMKICEGCELIDKEGSKCMVPGTAPCCGACGCKLSFKVRSLSSECAHPDGPKWEPLLEQEEEDKLYQDIDYNPDPQIIEPAVWPNSESYTTQKPTQDVSNIQTAEPSVPKSGSE